MCPGIHPALPGRLASASTPGPGQPSASTPGIMRTSGVAFELDVISGEPLNSSLNVISGESALPLNSSLNVELLATPGGFEWHRFLMGRPWGRDLIQQQVVKLRLVWRPPPEEGLALFVGTSTAPMRHVFFRGKRAVLSAAPIGSAQTLGASCYRSP